MSTPARICLCGFMGAGKTVVGRSLAAALGYRFVDLDARVAEHAGKRIPEIFATEGEARFRRTEEELGLHVLQEEKVVVAMGGGALENAPLRRRVMDTAFLVYLEASPEVLYERTRRASDRPLLEDASGPEGFLRVYVERMRARRSHYEAAHVTVATDGLSVDEVVAAIRAGLEKEGNDA